MKICRNIFIVLLLLTLALSGCGREEEIQAPEGKQVTLGTVEEGVYENTYLGVRFAPANWQIQGAEELGSTLREAKKMLEGSDLEENPDDQVQIMDMQAVSPDGLMNTNVIYTKMSSAEWLSNLSMDDNKALDQILSQKDAIIDSYRQIGVQVHSVEKAALNFAGIQRLGIKITASLEASPCHILQYYERTLGAYSAVVTMTSLQEDHTAEIAEMYESLNP